MPQYLLANYLPDNFDPSTMTEATVRAINDLNDELEAAGARLMACGLSPASQAKSLRGSPMASRSSPTARIWKPRSTSVVFGYWKPLTWTRRWRGLARLPSTLGRGARCARSHTAACRAVHLTHRGCSRKHPADEPAPPSISTTVSVLYSNEQSTHSSRFRYPHRRLWSGYGSRARSYASGG